MEVISYFPTGTSPPKFSCRRDHRNPAILTARLENKNRASGGLQGGERAAQLACANMAAVDI